MLCHILLLSPIFVVPFSILLLPYPTNFLFSGIYTLFSYLGYRYIMETMKMKIVTGREGLVGERGIALNDFDSKGLIKVKGEIWRARSEEKISRNDQVIVKDVKNLELLVRKLEEV